MGKMKDEMQENNPLLQVYMKILPVTVAAVAVIFILVKVISGLIAPDQLVLTAKYHDFEEGAVLQTPIRVAKDAEFEKEVKSLTEKKSGFMDILVFLEGTAAGEPVEEEDEAAEPENGTYTFTFENTKLPETIYIKNPEWWYPVNTEGNMTAPLKVGEKIDLLKDMGPLACGEAAFEITGIETVKISTGIFNINVTMTAAGESVPSDVKLIMGDEVFEEWDGSSELTYDNETGFADRTLVFRYNRSLRDDISDLVDDAVVVVQEYTVRRVFTEGEITSNIEGLEIVEVQ